ncbi:autotransporter outer membrane beta-barrel domain-containing protein [Pandoraea pulmonicola]|uniref:Autotransporter domain-containing protein n=1 Tax=Pandoraea pulmonicola TaxID=93221 RepID=A0ABM5RVE5_PANPU|nr:autotransporter outer membrane beta-barrel domain-containing protein [Pandoraea pulmonicola]AJC19409.1 hypothetical protein RO07_00890 [Pandoraea pulmonicola]
MDTLVKDETVNTAIADAKNALTKAEQALALLNRKVAVFEGVESKDASDKLKSTFILDANAASADKNGTVLSWNDINLKTFADEAAAGASGHAKIVETATLELGSFSGSESDAIHGAAADGSGVKTRSIDTLRVLADADHKVHVADGVLKMKTGIEGSGKIAIDVGAKGELNFLAEGTGIDASAENVTLKAHKATGSTEAAGKITFGKGTSAGKAMIELANGGELTFNEGASAGESKIAVGSEVTQDEVDAAARESTPRTLTKSDAGKLVFQKSSAGSATIVNEGKVEFKAANLDNATLKNEAKGTVTISGVTEKNGEGEDVTTKSLGGTALVTNHGTLTATDIDLQGLTLTNDGGTASITKAEGGEVILVNSGQNGKLDVSETKVTDLSLANAATTTLTKVNATGADVANAAGGTLTIGESKFGTMNLDNTATVAFMSVDAAVGNAGKAEGGKLTINEAEFGTLNLANAASATLSDVKADAAKVVNANGGTLNVSKAKLGDLTLTNTASATLTNVTTDAATVANAADGKLNIVNSQLSGLRLANEGSVTMSGTTTADNAVIRLTSGSLDVSGLDAGESGTKLGIGSLSGNGDVIAGNTALTIGSLNQDDVFGGRILAAAPPETDGTPDTTGTDDSLDPTDPNVQEESDVPQASEGSSDDPAVFAYYSPTPPATPTLTKVGAGNLTLTGDQSDVKSVAIQAGKLTAAHQNALGTGEVVISQSAALAISAPSVTGVDSIQNAGEIDLGLNNLSVQTYQSSTGASIKTVATKADGKIKTGLVHIGKDGDFSNTDLQINRDSSVKLKDVVGQNIQIVTKDDGATVNDFNEVKFGSVNADNAGDGAVTITEDSRVGFVAKNGAYTDNEYAVLASVDGVTYGDVVKGKVGGSVLTEMLEQEAGSAEQRRSARLLSGESLVNNAFAAQGSATAFQRGMQTRMIAGGAMFDDKTANGANADGSGVAGWAAFAGGNTSQRGNGPSFDVRGLDGAIGVDKRVGNNTIVGASVGMGNQNSKVKGQPGESKINSVSVGLYGSHLNDASWFVNGGVSYTNHSVKTDRTVAAGDVSARLSGKTSGRTFGAFGEVGKRFEVSGMNIDPSVGVRVASTRLNGFDETNRDGGGNDGLKVGAQSQTSTRGVLGVRLWREVANLGGTKVAPSLRLAYEHEFGDKQSSLTNTIHGAPRSFNVKGAKLGADIFTADLGVNVEVKKALDVRLGGNVSVRKGERAVGGSISAKYRF